MRLALAFVLSLSLFACKKKGPQPTLPPYPGAQRMAHGDTVELPQGTLFHTRQRTMDHAGQVMTFYAPEMERRGARRDGFGFQHENMARVQDGASAKDPSQPGVTLTVEESDRETVIEAWEMVPKAP